MAPREMVKHAALVHKMARQAVLSQGEKTSSDQTAMAGGVADGATAMSAPARRPTVISSVPGTEYRAAPPDRLCSRVVPPSETDAPRRGRRGR